MKWESIGYFGDRRPGWRIKVGRGHIYLDKRHIVHFIASFGPNNEMSFNGICTNADGSYITDMQDAKAFVENRITTGEWLK